jgi:hypothetical protein
MSFNNVINYFIKQTVICNFVLLQSILDYLTALLSTKPLNYKNRNYFIISLKTCKNPRLVVKSKGRGRDISLPKPPNLSGKFHTAHFI